MRIRLLSTIILGLMVLLSSEAFGQSPTKDKTVWQLSGLVVNKDTKEPVPYARIVINKSRRTISANEDGFYSIPVFPHDTVYFYALGYYPSFFAVDEYLKDYQGDTSHHYLYTINYLTEDSLILPDVYIFPYQTPAELRTAILNANQDESLEMLHARNNLDPVVMDRLIEEMEVNGEERSMVARQLYYKQYTQQNVAPVMPLFDPVAVYRLLKMINDKSKARKKDNLDYWLEDN